MDLPVLEAPIGDDVAFTMEGDSKVRFCAEVSISDDVYAVEGDVGVCVEITKSDDVSVVWIEVEVNVNEEYIDSLPPVYVVVSVNITDNAPVVIGEVEAGVTANIIVDVSEVETAVGRCCLIGVIDAIVFETGGGACLAVTLTDDSLEVDDDTGDSVGVTKTD